MPLQFPHPNHRHPIRCHEQRAIKDVPKNGIALCLTDSVHAGYGDIAARALPRRIEKKFAGPVLVEHADSDTEHVDFFELHSRHALRLVGRLFFEGARCSTSSKSLKRAVARLFRSNGMIPM